MSAEKQYADALKTIEFIEIAYLRAGKFTTYGSVCEALGYKPSTHARHVGQVFDVKITRTTGFTLYGDPAIL